MATAYNFRYLLGIGAFFDTAAVATQQKLDNDRQTRAETKKRIDQKVEEAQESAAVSLSKRRGLETVVAAAEAQRPNGITQMQTAITAYKTDKQAEATAQVADKSAQQADYNNKARTAYQSALPVDVTTSRVADALIAYGRAKNLALSAGSLGMLLDATYYLQQCADDLTAETRTQATDKSKPSAPKFKRLSGLVSRRQRAENTFSTAFLDFRNNLFAPSPGDVTEMDQAVTAMAAAAQSLTVSIQAMIDAGKLLISKTTLLNATLAEIEAADAAEEQLFRYGGFNKVFDPIGVQIEKNRRLQQIANSEALTSDINALSREKAVFNGIQGQIDALGQTIDSLSGSVNALLLETTAMGQWIGLINAAYTGRYLETFEASRRSANALASAQDAYNVASLSGSIEIEHAAVKLATTTQRLLEEVEHVEEPAKALIANLGVAGLVSYQTDNVMRMQIAIDAMQGQNKANLLKQRKSFSSSATAVTSPLAVIAGLNDQGKMQASSELGTETTNHILTTAQRANDLSEAAGEFQAVRTAGAAEPTWVILFDQIGQAVIAVDLLVVACSNLIAATTNLASASNAATQSDNDLQSAVSAVVAAQVEFEATLDPDIATAEYQAVQEAVEALQLAAARHRAKLSQFIVLRSVMAGT